MNIDCPQWVKEGVFYHIFPDRFAKSDRVVKPENLESWDSKPTLSGFKGGDLYGVIEKLDYLEDLGVNFLYLTPIFASTANHRYHTHDYFKVDPILGGDKALRELLDRAHDRGMRIILDGVFSHASRGFYQFNHTLENGKDSPYIDWFDFNAGWLKDGKPLKAYNYIGDCEPDVDKRKGFNSFGYNAWWDIPALPQFNIRNPQVREFIFDVARYWIDFGIDGWRLDVPEEIEYPGFWEEFRCRVRAGNPEAYIVGEVWTEAVDWLKGDRFDGVMNYLLGLSVLCFFAGDSLNMDDLKRCGYADVADITQMDMRTFCDRIQRVLSIYPRDIVESQLNVLTSHDTPRLLTIAQGDETAVRLIYAFVLTFVGVPCVYYGEEVGMKGGCDPESRRGFPKEDLWNKELREYIKGYIYLRRSRKSLQKGDFKILYSENDVLVYSRTFDEETTIVVLNVGKNNRTVEIEGNIKISVESRSARVLLSESDL